MKTRQLLTVLLCVSLGCVAGTSVVIAAQSNSAAKTPKTNQKKNKTVRKTSLVSPHRQMSEKEITECTTLINKVQQTDKALQKEMAVKVTNDAKMTEHLKKSADVQVFASDDPIAVAHLTGKTATLPAPSVVKQLPNVAKITPTPTSVAITKPMVKPIAKPTIPPNTQVFASDDPKAIAHLTGKTAFPTVVPILKSSPTKATTKPSVVIPPKPVAVKSTTPPAPHPHIELFAPNTPDLNHLQGKSANLAEIQKPASADKTVTTSPKNKKSTHKAKKPTTSTNAKKHA